MHMELQNTLDKYKVTVAVKNVVESDNAYRNAQKKLYALQDKVHKICKSLIEKELNGSFDVRIILYPSITSTTKK